MISLTNYDFQWARSELVIIYPDELDSHLCGKNSVVDHIDELTTQVGITLWWTAT